MLLICCDIWRRVQRHALLPRRDRRNLGLWRLSGSRCCKRGSGGRLLHQRDQALDCTLFGCDHDRGRVGLLTRPVNNKLNRFPRLASQVLGRRHDHSRLQPGKTYRHFCLGQDFCLGQGHLRCSFLIHQCAQRSLNQRGRGFSRGFRQPASGVCSLRRRFGCARVTP